jgi:hypothetical protein
MSKVTGGCLCGAVRYELNSAPKLSVSCHCRDCQYVSGGAPAHALIMRAEDVTITQGQVKEYWTLSAKGNRVARIFCEVCGTPLFAKNEKHPEFLPVKVGGLDDPSQLEHRPTSGPSLPRLGIVLTPLFRASKRIQRSG